MNVPHDIMAIYLTDICNFKCIFCSVDNPYRTEEKIKKETILKIIEDNKENEFSGVALWGGEPTTRKDFFEILDKVQTCNFDLTVIETNGYKLSDEEFLKKTIEKGINYFIISIHGATKEIQDKITRVDGSFDKVVKTIKNLKKNNISVRTNTVVNKVNYKQLPDIVKMLIDLDVDHFNISGLRVTGSAAQNFDLVTYTNFHRN